MKKERFGKKYIDNRNWKMYNKKLVKRGEAYIDPSFIKTWDEELRKQNRHKEGARFRYPDSLMIFAAYLHVLLGMDYRGIQGFLRNLAKLVFF